MLSSGALAAALVLAAAYALGGWRPGAEGRLRRRTVSVAAGAAVAYVFVNILPELGAGHRAVLEAAGTELLFAEERIYIVALAGFVVFYGLEHMVHTARARGREHAGEGAGDRLLGRILASSS